MRILLAVVCVFALAQAVPSGVKHMEQTRPILDTAPLPNGLNSKIINGQIASHGQIPYQAALIIDGNTFCGGSLISSDYVLTAGHCGDGARSVEVYLGAQNINLGSESGRQTITSSGITVHEQYDAYNIDNDIAVIALSQSASESNYVSPVQLEDTNSDSLEGATVTVSGWGKTSDSSSSISSQLRYVSLPVLGRTQCNRYYGNIDSTKICANGATGSSCNGDSGGPLTNGGVQVGIVSFGSSAGCESGYPSVYTRVGAYRDWITRNTGV